MVVTSGPVGDDLKRWRGSCWIIGIMTGREVESGLEEQFFKKDGSGGSENGKI